MTADQPRHCEEESQILTGTRNQEDNKSKVTSSLLSIKVTAKLEVTLGTTSTKQRPNTEPSQTKGSTINNESTALERI